jgi:hypothetical protein
LGVIAQTGTTTTGSAGLMRGTPASFPIRVTSGLLAGADVSFLYQVDDVSASGQRFTSRVGLSNAILVADPTDGIFFRQVDGVNSDLWQCVCRAGGTESVINTAVGITADTWVHLRIVANTAASIEFFINNVSMGSITTNIPESVNMASSMGILKATGTTNRRAYCALMSGKAARV